MEVVDRPVLKTEAPTLRSIVNANVEYGSTVYTEDAKMYAGMVDFVHEPVKHSVSESVKSMIHTNGMESFCAMLKRGYARTYHSFEHLGRYVNEFTIRYNMRHLDTFDHIEVIAKNMLKYKELVSRLTTDSTMQGVIDYE